MGNREYYEKKLEVISDAAMAQRWEAMGSGMLFVIVVLLSDLNSNFSSIRNIFGK
jgi:hypothetical protein